MPTTSQQAKEPANINWKLVVIPIIVIAIASLLVTVAAPMISNASSNLSTIAFEIEDGLTYEGPIVIEVDGFVSPHTAPIQRIGDLYLVTDDINCNDTAIDVRRNNTILDGQGHILTGTRETSGILLTLVENVTIQHFEIRNFSSGVEISYDCSNISVNKNTISGGINGIYLSYSFGPHEIKENDITDCTYGILYSSADSNSIISKNNITQNRYGIMFEANFDSSIIVDNRLENNEEYGIFVQGGESNYFARNSLIANGIGIFLTNFFWGSAGQYGQGYSQNNSIVDNYIAINTKCGLSIINSTGYQCHLPNYIYHNTFFNNTNHTVLQYGSFREVRNPITHEWETQYIIDNTTNVWDDSYPNGGNYWSDYTGFDTDGDGIGDISYVLDEHNKDRYPLVFDDDPDGATTTPTPTPTVTVTPSPTPFHVPPMPTPTPSPSPTPWWIVPPPEYARSAPTITPTPSPSPSPSPSPTPIPVTIDLNDMWDNSWYPTPMPTVPPTPTASPVPKHYVISVEGTAMFIVLVSLVGVGIAGILLTIRDRRKTQNPL